MGLPSTVGFMYSTYTMSGASRSERFPRDGVYRTHALRAQNVYNLMDDDRFEWRRMGPKEIESVYNRSQSASLAAPTAARSSSETLSTPTPRS